MMLGTHQRLHQLDYAPETTPFKLVVNDFEIRRVRKAKYLGLIVDENLTWEEFIDYVCGKIKRGVGVLKRIRHFIPKDSLLLLYQTLVEPYYRYCSAVWGNCGEVLKDKLQVQQNRAARISEMVKYEDADHEQLLINLGWLSVRNILAYELGVFMFKAVNKLAPEEINNLFMKQYEIHNHGTRSVEEGNLFLPQHNLSKGQKLYPILVQNFGMKSLQ